MKKSEFYKQIAAAWKLAEDSGVYDVVMTGNSRILRNISGLDFRDDPEPYTFAVAVVEGKAVFLGDELYAGNGQKFIVGNDYKMTLPSEWAKCTWTPPKPKTVVVEMLFEDVQEWCIYGREALEEYFRSSDDPYAKRSMRFYAACDTALSCISLGETK